ncbi:alpha/beta hydrolase [Chlamydia serpentis]|nr:alpha/beta hydrolase [Chlamydia serpentis]
MFSLTLLNKFTTFGILHAPLHVNPPHPTVVLLHGLASDKIGSKRSHVKLAHALTQLGIAALRVDLLGHGDCEGQLTDFSLEDYKVSTREIIEYAHSLPHLDRENLAIFGSSLGATLTLLTLPSIDKIKAIALWAPTISGELMSIELQKQPSEVISIHGNSEIIYSGVPLNPIFYSQFLKLDILKEQPFFPKNLSVLYMQGEKDCLVSVNHQKLFAQAFKNKLKKLTILTYPNVDHTFPLLDTSALSDLTQWLKNELISRE